MQRLLSKELWGEIRRRARNAQMRKAAISYVTRDLIGLRKGDVLIVDASTRAVASGETDAKVLRNLNRKGVHIFDCVNLHAKTILIDGVAFISSGNMSGLSANTLVEAGVITNHISTVSGVASFIAQLSNQSRELGAKAIAKLCKIKVVRRARRGATGSRKRKVSVARLGNRAWLIGVKELSRDPTPKEQRLIDQAIDRLRERAGDRETEYNWIKWDVHSRFAVQCKPGDSVLQIWRSRSAKRPKEVIRALPVLLKQKTGQWTRFYFEEQMDDEVLSWGKFKILCKRVGYVGRLSPAMAREIESDLADAFNRSWKRAG